MENLHGRIERQIKLPFREAVIIAARNIRARMFRSVLSMAGIVLAIAFLMFIWSCAAFDRHIGAVRGDAELDSLMENIGRTAGKDLERIQLQNTWLAGVSLILCGVGIANAMLMAVTERFREIGTMKCLGALDSLIMKLFLLESAFQGLVGTVVGSIIGFGLAAYFMHVKYGKFMLKYMPTNSLLSILGITVAVGVGLTILAALGPAFHAARMQPVEAMRVEE
ncbi:MAG: FtsX-like permease family protein [Planctomycetia bacterium]|nr:FtsX-like permease family protein [Planctomycetia bacterium]